MKTCCWPTRLAWVRADLDGTAAPCAQNRKWLRHSSPPASSAS